MSWKREGQRGFLTCVCFFQCTLALTHCSCHCCLDGTFHVNEAYCAGCLAAHTTTLEYFSYCPKITQLEDTFHVFITSPHDPTTSPSQVGAGICISVSGC